MKSDIQSLLKELKLFNFSIMREQCGPLLSPTDPVLHPPDHRHPAPLSDVHGEGDPGVVEDCQTVSSRHVESSHSIFVIVATLSNAK